MSVQMKSTARTKRPHTATMVGAGHPALSGPLSDLVTMLQDATDTVRSIESRVTDSAADAAVAMVDLAGLIHAANQLVRAATGIEVGAEAAYARRDEVSDPMDPFTEPSMTIRATGFVHEGSASELANLIGVSDGSAWTRTETAVGLSSRLPLILAAVTAGAIELWQAKQVLEECRLLTDDEARQVDEWLHSRLGTMEPTRLRAVTKYAIGRIDPDKVRQRATKTVADRTLEVTACLEPGLSQIYALVPAHQAAAIWEAADTLAAEYRELDPSLTADQARADAFVDLVLGDVDVSVTVTLGMPIVSSSASAVGVAHDRAEDPAADKAPEDLTEEDLDRRFGPEPCVDPPDCPTSGEGSVREESPACGEDSVCGESSVPTGYTSSEQGLSQHEIVGPDPDYAGPGVVPDRIPDWLLDEAHGVGLSCQVPGAGPLAGAFTTGVDLPRFGHIPADVIAALLGHLDLTVARALIDAKDGTVLETVTDAYRPTKRMREFVALRDGECRMYGCTRPAARCDVDHATAYDSGGATSPTNLSELCRQHHRAKQARHWTYDLDPDTGVATWVCRRTGTVRQTHPRTTLAAQEQHARDTARALVEQAMGPPGSGSDGNGSDRSRRGTRSRYASGPDGIIDPTPPPF